MKILILVDLLNNWALHNRAKAIKKYMPEHQVDIAQALNDDTWMNRAASYDVIHFNFSYGLDQYFGIINDSLKNRCVITVVNERSLLASHGVDSIKFGELLKACPFVTSVSQKITRMFPGHVKYIPNGIDPDFFPHGRTPTVGFAGVTDTPNKNVSAIQEACDTLGLKFISATYNRGDQKHHTHALENMHQFYEKLDVYVHASLTEGFNNTVIEALACNVPVLMTKEGCWEEFIGWVDFVEPTTQSITMALRKFFGRKLIDSKFTWPHIISQYKEIYESVVARAVAVS